MKKNNLADKVFVISGSTQGIGKEVATQILELGGKVVLNSRKKEKISSVINLLDQYKDHCFFIPADVSVAEEANLLISATIDHFGRIDVLINNAGVSSYGQLLESSPKVIEEIIKSNILGSVFPTRFAIPHLIKSKGKVLFVSSLAAFHGIPEYSLYSGSKMALTAFYQSLKKEMHAKGVFVGIAYVGFTKNDTEKRTFAPDGKLVKIPERNNFKVNSQQKTAQLLLKQLIREDGQKVHSVMGKFAFVISRLFPSLMDHIFMYKYKKTLTN